MNDVANAVMDGADAVMLSGETSVGKHPALVIKTMSNIIKKVEEYDGIYNHNMEAMHRPDRFVSDNICESGVGIAKAVDAKAIITMTHSGYTAFKIASRRPKSKVYLFTSNRSILNMVNLIWGVKGFYYDDQSSTDKTIADIQAILTREGLLKEKDYYITITSMPIKEKGMTNTIKLSQV